MRKTFRHYFKPTKEALSEAWRDCLFSFDSSVLLNVYGYSGETREKLVSFTEQNENRIRLPHQFGLEYSRNRVKVILKQISKYAKVEDALRQIKETSIAPKRDHPYLTKKSFKAFEAIQEELADSRKSMEKWLGLDPYAERLFKAFENRIGKRPSEEELVELHRKAEDRYKRQIPPGFVDRKDKDAENSYGDYVGWNQLMQIAKAEEKSIILVIDDLKEDWWYTVGDRQPGPRPELLEEFEQETKQELYMYTSENFLRAARDFTSADIRDDVIEEIRERLEGQRIRQRSVEFKPSATELRIDQVDAATSPAVSEKASELKSKSPGPQDKPDSVGS